jgi:predicted lipoprotein
MSHRRRDQSGSEPPPRYAGLGACLAIALGVFGACTTEDPREFFRTSNQNRLPGASASGAGPQASAGGGQNSGGVASKTGNASSASGRGGRSGSENSGDAGGEAGHDGSGATPGSGASHAGSTNGGESTSGGASASGGMGATSGDGGTSGSGSPPSDDCGDRPVSSEPFTKRALRTAAADCAIWHYCKFEAQANWLEQASRAHVAAPSPDTLANARAAWTSAMATWSAVELFQFGPLSSRADSEGKDNVHGQGLREFVYSWPRFTRCRVEEQVASERYAIVGFPNIALASRGLYAQEYLLFYEDSDTACDAGSATATTWAGLDAAALTAHKHRYLTAVSADVLAIIRQLLELWRPSGGNFRETFIDATGYQDEQQALTILAWSLVYLEREVKDWKLGVPLGVTATNLVNGPEAPFAYAGTDNIRQNLRGFRALFQGCGPAGEGLGFDDWLAEAGHAELGQDIVHAIDAADAFASAFPALHSATPDQLEAFYRIIKSITDYLKADLFGDGSPLGLDLPEGVVGDTD